MIGEKGVHDAQKPDRPMRRGFAIRSWSWFAPFRMTRADQRDLECAGYHVEYCCLEKAKRQVRVDR